RRASSCTSCTGPPRTRRRTGRRTTTRRGAKRWMAGWRSPARGLAGRCWRRPTPSGGRPNAERRMSVLPFTVGRQPSIVFGAGTRGKPPEGGGARGGRLLLVGGERALEPPRHWAPLADAMGEKKLAWVRVRVPGEPSPDVIDAAVREHRAAAIDAVVGIG